MENDLIHESAAAYALDALSADEERAYEAHLAVCVRCQEEVAGFSEAAAAIAYAAPAAEVPPGLREGILAAARADRASVIPLRPRWAYPAAAAAAVAACAAIGLGVWAGTLASGTTEQALQTLPLRGATGSVIVAHGGNAVLVVSGLPHAPAGKTYEVWVMQGTHAAPAGVFSGAGRTVTVRLTHSVPAGAMVGVTVEHARGALTPSMRPLFTSAPA